MPRSLARFLACPLTPILAGAVFLTSVWMLPIQKPSPSPAGEWIAELLGEGRSTTCIFPIDTALFARDGDRITPITQEAFDVAFGSDRPVFAANLYRRSLSRGLWAPTSQTRSIEVMVQSTDEDPTSTGRVRALYVDALAGRRPGLTDYSVLRTRDVVQCDTVWSGYLHNAASLASFLLLAISAPLASRRAWRALRTPPQPPPPLPLRPPRHAAGDAVPGVRARPLMGVR